MSSISSTAEAKDKEKQQQQQLSSNDAAAVERFKAFLRIRTITEEGPITGANAEAITFLKSEAEKLGLTTQVLEYVKGRPILIATWKGSDVSLPSILLNSHYDVVPVMASHWHYDPFGATELENGDIVARGAQVRAHTYFTFGLVVVLAILSPRYRAISPCNTHRT